MQIIAYTYDADYRCKECTIEYIASNYAIDVSEVAADYDDYQDSEGNPIHPVFDTDEWYANDVYAGHKWAVLTCGSCDEEIEVLKLGEVDD